MLPREEQSEVTSEALRELNCFTSGLGEYQIVLPGEGLGDVTGELNARGDPRRGPRRCDRRAPSEVLGEVN